jgi:hypothetical protein
MQVKQTSNGLHLDLKVAFSSELLTERMGTPEEVKEQIYKRYLCSEVNEFRRIETLIEDKYENSFEDEVLKDIESVYKADGHFYDHFDFSWKTSQNLLSKLIVASNKKEGSLYRDIIRPVIEYEKGEKEAVRYEGMPSGWKLKDYNLFTIWDFYSYLSVFFQRETNAPRRWKVELLPVKFAENNYSDVLPNLESQIHFAIKEIVDEEVEKIYKTHFLQENNLINTLTKAFIEKFEYKYMGMPYSVEFHTQPQLRYIDHSGDFPLFSNNISGRKQPLFLVEKCMVTGGNLRSEKLQQREREFEYNQGEPETDWTPYATNEWSRSGRGHRGYKNLSLFDVEADALSMLQLVFRDKTWLTNESIDELINPEYEED